MLSTAIVARLAKAGIKAAMPLVILKERVDEEVLKNSKVGLWNWFSVQIGQHKC